MEKLTFFERPKSPSETTSILLIFTFLETSEFILSKKKEFGMDSLEISKIQFSQIFALKCPLISKTCLIKPHKVHESRGLFIANIREIGFCLFLDYPFQILISLRV